MKKINLGIFGAGTVGGGVVKILQQKKEFFESNGIDFCIKKICVRDANKKRDFVLPKNTVITTDPEEILADEEIDIFVELIGGVGLAKKIVFSALEKNKHVVTANKALIAENFLEIEKILEENPDAKFNFEASVAGGIPIINTLKTHFSIDKVFRISAILNGTTNFILSKMEKEKADYASTLKEAQDLGYAEADPTADTEGLDARAKIIILTKLLWGIFVPENNIFTQGISSVSSVDFQYAKMLEGTIKLLAISEKIDDKYSVFVTPALVPFSNSISQISGATNVIEIESEFLQKSFLVGPGAGRFPTANSIVADIFDIAKNPENTNNFLQTQIASSIIQKDFQKNFYIRINIKDGLGIIKKVGEICEKNQVSIDSVLQLPIKNTQNLPFVITTDQAKLSQIKNIVDDIEKEDFCLKRPFFIPIL